MSIKLTESRLRQIIKEEVIKKSKSRKLRESYAGYGYDSSTDKAFNDLAMALNKLVFAGVVKKDIIEIVETEFGDYEAAEDEESRNIDNAGFYQTPDNYWTVKSLRNI